jgi:RNA binding exosome subunit
MTIRAKFECWVLVALAHLLPPIFSNILEGYFANCLTRIRASVLSTREIRLLVSSVFNNTKQITNIMIRVKMKTNVESKQKISSTRGNTLAGN